MNGGMNMKKLSVLVMLLIACGMMLPSLANLPTEDGCDKKWLLSQIL